MYQVMVFQIHIQSAASSVVQINLPKVTPNLVKCQISSNLQSYRTDVFHIYSKLDFPVLLHLFLIQNKGKNL